MALVAQKYTASLMIYGYIHRIECSKKFKRKRYKNIITRMNDAIINICIQYYFIPKIEPFPTGKPLRIAILGYYSHRKILPHRFIFDECIKNPDSIIEDIYSKQCVVDGYKVDFHLLDFYSIGFTMQDEQPLDSDCIMMIYDITKIETLQYIKDSVYMLKRDQEYWLKHNIDKNAKFKIFIIVGDTSLSNPMSHDYNVSKMGKELANEINCEYMEACPRNGNNVNECFYKCAILYLQKYGAQFTQNNPVHKSRKKCFIL